jgi:energy-coupling factor transport system ATP-binding protein
MAEPAIVSVEGVWFAYPGADWTLRDVSVRVEPGEYVAIIGANGAGKTTLAKQLNGLLLPDKGQVRVQGQDTASLRPGDLARAVGYVFQNPDHQIFAATTREEVAFGPGNLGLTDPEVLDRVGDALARFGLDEAADAPPAVLGFPLRRKVALAAVYAMRPRVLILDEPTGGLDRDSVREVMEAVADLHREGHSIVLITHDMRLVASQTERVVLLQDGRIALDTSPARAFAPSGGLGDGDAAMPQITRLSHSLARFGVGAPALNVQEFVSACAAALSPGRHDPDGTGRC